MIEGLSDELLSRNLTSREIAQIEGSINGDACGLLLYGSYARGDVVETSDVDLLILSRRPAPTLELGRLSIVTYTDESLRGTSRTLFGTHLLRDGVVLWQEGGSLSNILKEVEEARPLHLITRVARMSTILAFPIANLAQHLEGHTRLSRYLLRTAIYASSMLSNSPTFSVRQLAESRSDSRLNILLSSKEEQFPPYSCELLLELIHRLEDEVGPRPRHTYGSLESLAVGFWDYDRDLSSMAIKVGVDRGFSIAYTELKRVSM